MTAKQKKDRDDRTVFVGNIALSVTGHQISKEFKEYGKVLLLESKKCFDLKFVSFLDWKNMD